MESADRAGKGWSRFDAAWWIIPLAAGFVLTLELLGPTGFPFGKKTSVDPVVALFAFVVIVQAFRLHRFEVNDK